MPVLFTGGLNNYYRNSSHPAVTSQGTILIRLKPNWNHNDGQIHVFYHHGNSSGFDLPSFQKYNDGNVYIGFYTGTEERIIVTADSGMFTSGVWANHWLVWDEPTNQQYYLVNDTNKGSQTTSLAAVTADGLTIANYNAGTITAAGGNGIDSDTEIAFYVRWNRALDMAELATINKTNNPRKVKRGLVSYIPMFGRHAVEPDLVSGFGLTPTGGSAAIQSFPVVPLPPQSNRRRLSRDPSPKTRITRSTATNDTGDGTIAWTNLANVLGTDTSTFAQAIGPANTASAVTNNLVIDDLRFRPPIGVTIVGIEVSYYAWVDVALDFSHDSVILETFPVRNGVVEDGVASIGSPYLDTTRVQYTYGGATNLLGLTWDDNDTFGFAIRATSYDDLGNAITIKVNQPSVTVWYSNGSSQVFVAELVQQSQPRRELRVAIPYHV